jgi:hypothetical protein
LACHLVQITMSESKRKKSRQQRFLIEHPDCYFCGGIGRATTIDHVPPRACFPRGYAPEGFEFPACQECNKGADRDDQIFGMYSMLLDFDESKTSRQEHIERLLELRKGIKNNYSDALPDLTSAMLVPNQAGSIPPAAIALETNLAFKEASKMMGWKLTHALYMLETGKILTVRHLFQCNWYQPQWEGTESLTSYFSSLLPNETIGARSNIKPYGDRFRYISGTKETEDFFMYAAQFGHGLILWGIVCGPNTKTPDPGPLVSAPWSTGACGPGANAPG